MQNKEEYILCAAIWYKDLPLLKPELLKITGFAPFNVDKGIVFCGWRHPNCMYAMISVTGKRSFETEVGEYEQGFLTSKNRFVDRKEGAKIAWEAKQTEKELVTLYSEDLY